ncbi:MAG: flagellar biosynthetic protein FliO, partial [Armatimonadota bacterium]|nr:flagellar biosynthetic protein FliO [Armatimonadota bacterium]
PAPAPTGAVKSAVPLPDYGGRDSALGSAIDNSNAVPSMSPLAQVGKALEALVIVLALVVGGLYGLKRLGVIKADGTTVPRTGWAALLSAKSTPPAPASDLIALLGSQTLPNTPGAGLHVVSIAGRTLLLGATPQSVTLLTELDAGEEALADTETEVDGAAFAAYLQKAGVTPPPAEAGRAAEQTLARATDRLQSLLARSRKDTSPL